MIQPKDGDGSAKRIAEDYLTDSAVTNYLRKNPDFFVRCPEVLDGLKTPARWSGDGVVDMQHYLISRSRTEIDELRDCALDVIETSRTNMSTQARAHAAVLAIMALRRWSDIVHVVTHDWPLLLDVDVVSLACEPNTSLNPWLAESDLGQLESGAIDRLLGVDQDVRLFDAIRDDGMLFGSGAGLVNSAALVRMNTLNILPPGLLALGARGSTFRPGQGTELLVFMCRVLEHCIIRACDSNASQIAEFGD